MIHGGIVDKHWLALLPARSSYRWCGSITETKMKVTFISKFVYFCDAPLRTATDMHFYAKFISLLTMIPTKSILHGWMKAIMIRTLLWSLIMSFTSPSLHDMIITSLMAARFLLRTMCDTNSSLNSYIVTSLMAARFHLRTMCDTNSFLHDIIVTPLKLAFLLRNLRSMRYTNSTLWA